MSERSAAIPSREECENTILTTDGQGREQKTIALYYLLSEARTTVPGDYVKLQVDLRKAQQRIFLMEARIQDFREDRKKWLNGEDNASLREEIVNLKDQIKDLKKNTAILASIPAPRPKVALCFYCEHEIGTTKDHFIPKSKGGGLGMNVVLACHSCNNRKGNSIPTEKQIRKYIQLWKKCGIELEKFMQIVVDDKG